MRLNCDQKGQFFENISFTKGSKIDHLLRLFRKEKEPLGAPDYGEAELRPEGPGRCGGMEAGGAAAIHKSIALKSIFFGYMVTDRHFAASFLQCSNKFTQISLTYDHLAITLYEIRRIIIFQIQKNT